MPERLLEPLDPLQRQVAQAVSGTVVVIAVAGAGKTRAIAHRIAYAVQSGAQPANTGLAVTYTTKAAAELGRRLSALGVDGVATGTLHSAALRQLTHFWPTAIGGKPWRLVSDRSTVLADLAAIVLDGSTLAEQREVVAAVERAKAQGLSEVDETFLAAVTGDLAAPAAEVWRRYQSANDRAGLLDFDDVLQLLLGLLRTRPDLAEQVRRRYQWFTIDEYQDATPLQAALIQEWVGERREICVVGDPNQAIYDFAGADARLLTALAAPSSGNTVIELDATYRCAPEIVAAASNLVSPGGLKPRSLAPAGNVSLERFGDVESETGAVARQIAQLVAEGVDPRQIALLVRVGAQLVKYELALDRLGIPYLSRGAIRAGNAWVKRMVVSLKSLIGMAGGDLIELVEEAGRACGLSEPEVGSEEWQVLSGLLALAEDLLSHHADATLSDYLVELERRLANLDPPAPKAVTLQTMHSAKGLEWDVVFLPELTDNWLPYPRVPEESESNLLYVAMTRARRDLRLSAAREDAGKPTRLTRFLDSVTASAGRAANSPVYAVVERQQQRPVALPPCQDCGRGLTNPVELRIGRCAQCHSERPAELAALTKWRSEKASALGIAPRLLVTDSSLAVLAHTDLHSESDVITLLGPASSRAIPFAAELLAVRRAALGG